LLRWVKSHFYRNGKRRHFDPFLLRVQSKPVIPESTQLIIQQDMTTSRSTATYNLYASNGAKMDHIWMQQNRERVSLPAPSFGTRDAFGPTMILAERSITQESAAWKTNHDMIVRPIEKYAPRQPENKCSWWDTAGETISDKKRTQIYSRAKSGNPTDNIFPKRDSCQVNCQNQTMALSMLYA